MRVAILADPIDNQKAGIHHYTRELVSNLGKLKTDVEYFAITENKHQFIGNIQNICVINRKMPGYKAFRMFVLIPLLIRKLNVDIVVEPAHFGPFNLPRRVKRVTVIHDLTPILFPQYHLFHSSLLQRMFLGRILSKASLIIANSKYTVKDILKVYPNSKGKVSHIYLGKDEIFKPQINVKKVLDKYEIPHKYFLFVGTIEPRKNILALLKAFTILKDKSKAEYISLIIIGQKGWKCEDIFQSIDNHQYKNDIILPGYVDRDDLPAIYSGAIACVQPSYYEGFGMTVVEALSCGTPCIVSDISSLPEIGGEAVLLFDPKSPDQLYSQMKLILDDPQLSDSLKQKALKRSSNFDWNKHVVEFDKLMKKLL